MGTDALVRGLRIGRQVQVEQHQIDLSAPDEIERLGAVTRFRDRVVVLEREIEKPPRRGFVVHDGNGLHSSAPAGGIAPVCPTESTLPTSMRTEVPPSSPLVTSIRPSSRSNSRAT